MIEDSFIHLAFAFLKSIIFMARLAPWKVPLAQTLPFPVLSALSPFLHRPTKAALTNHLGRLEERTF
jgi:hypothetical protein